MMIFLSYASEDRPLAEEIQLALAGAGHEVFFDRESLPAGGDYHARIKASVDAAELFVFLVSPDSVAPGGYALTEMGYARSRWAHPKGHVLPVLLRPTPFAAIPAYLKSVTVLEPSGNTAAEVLAAVVRLPAPPADKTPAPAAGLRTYALFGAAGVLLLAGAFYATRDEPNPPLAPALPVAAGASTPARAVGPELPNPVQLRFSYKPVADAKVALDDTLRVNLQTRRRIVDGERLAQQPGGFYSYNTAYPAEDERILGTLMRELRASSLVAPPAPARFCLKRPPALEPSTDQHVHLDCDESNSCKLHFPSPKWLEPCPVEELKTSRSFSLWPLAFAADTQRRWSVPSAKTLAAHKGQMKGVGYTLVSIETDAMRDPAIIGVEVEVRVNGVPVLEDGLPAALRPVPNDPSQPFRHSYALESLDFEGAQAGCEAIVLTLRPRLSSGKTGEAASVTLPYVALRDAPGKSVPFGKGTLTWSAKYVIPASEWSHEAFIGSVTYAASGGDAAAATARARAVALKQAFDRLGLKHASRPLVAVIRPPLTLTGDTLAFGLTAGVVQPSGQVRFTFSPQDANAIGDAMLAARG
ncbi:MAG: toll/interleukin-1 receptor domain-containing protein, partial [Rubrivivax sp.]